MSKIYMQLLYMCVNVCMCECEEKDQLCRPAGWWTDRGELLKFQF